MMLFTRNISILITNILWQFTPEIKNLLLEEASSGFNWAGISPTIFGAVFESTIVRLMKFVKCLAS